MATRFKRKAYGFEIKKEFFNGANKVMFKYIERSLFA